MKFACAVPVGTTKFLWLLAGPQKEASNSAKFNGEAGPEDMAIYDSMAKKFNQVSQFEKEQDK